MKQLTKGLAAGLIWVWVLAWPGSTMAATPPENGCAEIVTLLKEENSKRSGELRRIQREIAALRADMNQPGLKDVFAGIGYILGLFGVAAFMAARRKE